MGTAQPFRSELRGHLKGRSEALEAVWQDAKRGREMLARELSVRDIEDAFKDETGRLLLSATAVSELVEGIRPGQRCEPVLVRGVHERWRQGSAASDGRLQGGRRDGECVLPGVAARPKGRRSRGLGDPLLVVSEGAAGIIKAIGTCFTDDFEACIDYLRLPIAHRRATRTKNLLERLLVEEDRRLRIIPNAFGEKPVLKLMFSAIIRATERWRAIKLTDFERRQMAALRKQLDQVYEAQFDRTKQHPKMPATADDPASSRP